jgi:uncharacterized protein
MKMPKVTAALAVFCFCSLGAACSPLAPQPDRSKYFVLSPVAEGSLSAPASAGLSGNSTLTIGIGPIEFPDYLKRPEVITRTSANQLDLSSEKRWGEPLDKDFARVFAENISRLLNTQQIEKYPWPVRTRVDYQISVDVQRFETTSDGQAELVARWIIKDGTGKDLYASETSATLPASQDENGSSAALSGDLDTLSREIAEQVVEFRRREVPVSRVEDSD